MRGQAGAVAGHASPRQTAQPHKREEETILMIRLAKYLKPYIWLILICIALLFVQAMCDLALPDYMSKIVNDGIQQGGVVNAAPDAVRQSQMDKLTLFMSAGDKARALADYRLVQTGATDYEKYLRQYPALAEQPIYVLTDVAASELTWLNGAMGKAFLAVSGIEQMLADPAKAATMGQGAGFDLSKLPAGTDVFALLGRLPEAQRSQITAALNQRFTALGDRMIAQSAAVQVKAEYVALGMDAGKLQTNYILQTGLIMLAIALLAAACWCACAPSLVQPFFC